jgi:ribosomal protein S18 acetylase RimI-like enzyme
MGEAMTARDAAVRAGVEISIAGRDELAELLDVQHEAFGRVAAKFDIDPQIMPPVAEDLDTLQALYDRGFRFFIARHGGCPVGTVRAEVDPDGTVEVGRLGVDAAHVRRGIARALMLALEESYPEARRFRLFTGARAVEPLSLYDQLGYRIESHESERGFELVWLVKPGPAA